MAAGRALVQAGTADEFSHRLAETAQALPVGNPASDQVALGPLINARQVDHAWVIVDATDDDQGDTTLIPL